MSQFEGISKFTELEALRCMNLETVQLKINDQQSFIDLHKQMEYETEFLDAEMKGLKKARLRMIFEKGELK